MTPAIYTTGQLLATLRGRIEACNVAAARIPAHNHIERAIIAERIATLTSIATEVSALAAYAATDRAVTAGHAPAPLTA